MYAYIYSYIVIWDVGQLFALDNSILRSSQLRDFRRRSRYLPIDMYAYTYLYMTALPGIKLKEG